MFKNYINVEERQQANKQLPKLMVEGLLLGGTGLGVLALIFEIAADAFSVAAYQTLLAIHGAEGHHDIAIMAFIVLSVLLFLGIVPAYKAGAYLRPNAGGSGPLVEAIGPPKMRWLSWVGTSLFFLDAILTIIISSISASDVTMLLFPELASYRIVLAELYAFFIMAVLVILGPKRAVPLFLIGGGAFTLFTMGALGLVGLAASGNPEWAFLSNGIISRLEGNGVIENVVRAQQDVRAIGSVLFFQLFFRSMASAMLGFSGYEVIPASGKHAARPKWKVINTALTLAAIFLIGTGVVQLYAAQQWNIPATEGYSTLLIEYEIVATQMLGRGVDATTVEVTAVERQNAQQLIEEREVEQALSQTLEAEPAEPALTVDELAVEIATIREMNGAIQGTQGATFLSVAGFLLAFILLLAQGGGYVGGAAVAANAAQLGRLPQLFTDDRNGIMVIWGFSAVLIPIIREVVVVEAYYAFGFVSAFVITSMTVLFVQHDALIKRDIQPGSAEAKSLRFAGLRGMIASLFMLVVLVTQKTDALVVIVLAGACLTIFQMYVAHRRLGWKAPLVETAVPNPGEPIHRYSSGVERAYNAAWQRGVVTAVDSIIEKGEVMGRFNIGPERIRRVVSYLYNITPELFTQLSVHNGPHQIEEPSAQLSEQFERGRQLEEQIVKDLEHYSNFGIFTFVHNYHLNWVDEAHGRDAKIVEQAMLDILYPTEDHDTIWETFTQFQPARLPEPLWQFSRQRYIWAKDQWPNLSDRITTIWTLQDFGLLPLDVDVKTVVSIAGGKAHKLVKIPSTYQKGGDGVQKETLE